MNYQSSAVNPIESIGKGWNLIKDNYWLFFGMTLVAVVIMIIVSIVIGLINNAIVLAVSGVLGLATQNSGDVGKASATILPQILSLIIGIFTNIITATLAGIFYCGIYKALSRQAMTGMADFNDLFSGFSKIQECLIVAVVTSIIGFFIGLVMIFIAAALGLSAFGVGMLIQDGHLNPAVFGGLLVAFIVILVVSIILNLVISSLTAFIYPLIGERDAGGFEAVLLSIKSGFSNIIGLIILMFLLFLMLLGGAIACLIGMLFVLPIAAASIYAAYQSVFGLPNNNYKQTPPPPPNFGYQQGF